jgi:transglutaminase-like putative cysteine protease
MRLTIDHTTRYGYEHPPKQLIQLLRLTPRADAHQRVLEWGIQTPGRQSVHTDSFGNLTHTHVLTAPQAEFTVTVRGVVEVAPLSNGMLWTAEDPSDGVPALAFLVPTPLTAGFGALDALVCQALPQAATGSAPPASPADLLRLAAHICDALPYQPGATDATTSAEAAFVAGAGVCQDHAHAMIAACRVLDWPARYVSGYVDPGHSRAAASHAWVDVFLRGSWFSVDVTNGSFASDAHCRLAVGRDYLDACPVRGVREGGHTEQMDVQVRVLTQQ